MATPIGWKLTYENGRRQAVNPQGEVVAYNQYLNAQARQSGFTSHSDYRKHAQLVSGYRTKENASLLELGSKKLADLKRLIIDRKGLTPEEAAPHGEFARFLESIGKRPIDAPFPVGDTP